MVDTPDPIGLDTGECWNEEGDVLYCSRFSFTRGQAKLTFAKWTGEWFPDVRCRRVWMRLARAGEYGPWDEFYVECPKPEAEFECWRVELK